MKPSKILIDVIKSNLQPNPITSPIYNRHQSDTMSSPRRSSSKSLGKSLSSPTTGTKLSTIDESNRFEDEIANDKMGDLFKELESEATANKSAHEAADSKSRSVGFADDKK